MKAAWLILLAAAAPVYGQQALAVEKADTCLECHGAMEGDLARPAQLFADDIHKENGFSCVDCHGGEPSSYDPEESMSVNKGFRGTQPSPSAGDVRVLPRRSQRDA